MFNSMNKKLFKSNVFYGTLPEDRQSISRLQEWYIRIIALRNVLNLEVASKDFVSFLFIKVYHVFITQLHVYFLHICNERFR